MGESNSNSPLYLFLAIIVIVGISAIIFISNWAEKYSGTVPSNVSENEQECLKIGCPENTTVVGSISTQFYYYCTCSNSKKINSSDLICFKSRQEAVLNQFYKGYCG